MSRETEKPFQKSRDLGVLVFFLALSAVVWALGGAVTAQSVGSWYQILEKPPFNPPDWVFPPVWSLLFILMALAAWRVWRRGEGKGRRLGLFLYGLQLLLNLGWSVLFFGYRLIAPAFFEIIVLWLCLSVVNVIFWRIDRLAGILFLPYLLWVAYALLLTAAIWRLN